jgi:hypothetical protein
MLETQETLPSSISSASASRHLRRVHAEHHSSFVLSTLRTTFSLDIPSDGSPAFKVKIGEEQRGEPHGGLEWKVRLCLLVAVAAESSNVGTQGVRMKNLVRDGWRGEWGSSWKAGGSIAPMERALERTPYPSSGGSTQSKNLSWTAFFVSSFLGSDGEGGGSVGGDHDGGEEGWREVGVETVECEVPIKVWAGNTAFKAMEVVFEL